MSAKIWFITGISRGLGRSLAQAALHRGDLVIGTSRNGSSNLESARGMLHLLPLEVTDRKQVFATIAKARDIGGRLDVVVNNAGYGLLSPIESASFEEVTHVTEVNYFGSVHVVQAALPYLRKQRSGHIVNITSIGGFSAYMGSGFYSAAKFAVEGMSLSLAQEVSPLGIKVTLVEPGAFRTDFLEDTSIRLAKAATEIEDYAGTSGQKLQALKNMSGKQAGDPDKAAAAILAAIDAPHPPLHLFLGTDALKRAHQRLEQVEQQLRQWETLTLSTDYSAGD